MNMWGFTREIFPELSSSFLDFLNNRNLDGNSRKEFLIHGVVQRMIADGGARVRVLHHRGRWCGITYPQDRSQAKEFIADLVERGEYPSRLWE